MAEIAATVGAGVGAALWGAATVIPGFIGFGTSGIAANSMAASLMSMSAIANGGSVAAGGFVATAQSIGAAGLAVMTGPALVIGGTAVGAGFFLLKKSITAGAVATSIWASPSLLVGIRAIGRAAAGANVIWIVCWLVGNALRCHIFGNKEEALTKFDELPPAYNKMLIDPEEKTNSSDITTYTREKKWILYELCAKAEEVGGEIQQHTFDDEDDGREAFDDSSAAFKVLVDCGGKVSLQHPTAFGRNEISS